MVVDNRPGGALTIGIDAVAKAARRLHPGPGSGRRARDHAPHGGEAPLRHRARPPARRARHPGYMLLAVSPKTDFHSVKDLIEFARKNPGKLSNASSSNGSPGHVSGELFKHMTGTDIVHIPYKGGAPAVADLIAGNVQLMFESTNSIAPHVKAGRVRALAVTGERRSSILPESRPSSRAVAPGYEVNAWSGIITTAGVPRPVLDKLNAAVNQALLQPDTKERLAQLGSEGGGGPEAFAELIRRDSASGPRSCAAPARRSTRRNAGSARLLAPAKEPHETPRAFRAGSRFLDGNRANAYAGARHDLPRAMSCRSSRAKGKISRSTSSPTSA